MKKMKSNKGLSLIEVLVALGISSIVLLGILTMVDLISKSSIKQTIALGRAELVNRIRVQSMNFDNIRASAVLTRNLGVNGLTPNIGSANAIDHYSMLEKCTPDISNSGAVGCDKASMDDSLLGNKFYLADTGSLDASRSIAGEDVYYSSNGVRCSQTAAVDPHACPIFARVWFEPYCMNFLTACNKAMSVTVRYSVGARPDSNITDLPEVAGEVYVPLQKGIMITRLLDQSDLPISANSKGIFVIQKFYGKVGQSVSGLRLESTINNPIGLTSMKIQMRSLVGPSAKSFSDNMVPGALTSATWRDIDTPGNESIGPWTIDLSNAKANQIFNFGTQMNATSNSRTTAPNIPANFAIGSADPLNIKFRWTKNIDNQLVEPEFKSGFYQFRILATSSAGDLIESTNYVTVRLVSQPEVIYVNPSFSLSRNCVDSTQAYTILIADDEYVSDVKLKVNGQNQSVGAINSDRGSISTNFDISQAAGNYTVETTVKNNFSDVVLETLTTNKVVDTQVVSLAEVPPVFNPPTSSPATIRINTTGSVRATFSTGNCCSETPGVNWAYPSPAAFGSVPLLSGPASSTMTCTTTGNSRSCSTSITATGINIGPPIANPPNDINASLVFASGTPESACRMSPSPAAYTQGKYVPVVKNPNIYFYLKESLWLNVPGGSIKAISPKVYVRADFNPEEDVQVRVVKDNDPAFVVCDLTFTGSAVAGNPVDKTCDIPAGFSGDLVLQKHPASVNVQTDADAPNPIFKAKVSGTLIHRTCNANLTAVTDQPAKYTVPMTLPMEDSPYGYTRDADGNKIQDSKNDTGLWTSGTEKNLRCYDAWAGSSPYSDTDSQQDYYNLYKWNSETRLTILPVIPPEKHISIASSTSPLVYGAYTFPSNPPYLIDTSSANIPYLYAVYQSGSPQQVLWRYKEGTGAAATTSPVGWEDVTSQVCSGSASLSTTRLARMKMNVQSNNPNIIMKATNGFYSQTGGNAKYSYLFMCQYGRWHPAGSGSVGWTN